MENIHSYGDYFIINESRAQIIDPKGISFNPDIDVLKHPKEILEKYAPWYNPTEVKTPLYRAVNREHYDPYLLQEPKKRKYIKNSSSSNTRNYINMIVDEEWVGYPNRSDSIIGNLIGKPSSMLYGDFMYRVIPLKSNSKVAVAPSGDFWHSFDLYKLGEDLGNHTLSTKGLDTLLAQNLKLKRFYSNKKDFQADLNTRNSLKKISSKDNYLDYLKEIENKYGSIYNFLTFYISPENGLNIDEDKKAFQTIKYNKSTVIDGQFRREFWTNAPCLLIKEEWYGQGNLIDVYNRS